MHEGLQMKKWLIPAVMSLALAVPAASANANPIFGGAKVKTMDSTAMKKVTGQNTTSAYYAYLGTYYAAQAQQYGSYGAYLEAYGGTYQSSRNTYYQYAYGAAYNSYIYYYYAYYYN
jgi:hypothetical protein